MKNLNNVIKPFILLSLLIISFFFLLGYETMTPNTRSSMVPPNGHAIGDENKYLLREKKKGSNLKINKIFR